MARSFRLDPGLEKRLEEVARVQGIPVSALIREAVARHCDEVADHSLRVDLADVIGSIETKGGRAKQTGNAFRKLLKGAHRR
ncbi:MAG TPA: ribbon-helix-helix protein, CopG family [Candidatus Xenobia bacterium]|jgi:predicted DNA-binding protein